MKAAAFIFFMCFSFCISNPMKENCVQPVTMGFVDSIRDLVWCVATSCAATESFVSDSSIQSASISQGIRVGCNVSPVCCCIAAPQAGCIIGGACVFGCCMEMCLPECEQGCDFVDE